MDFQATQLSLLGLRAGSVRDSIVRGLRKAYQSVVDAQSVAEEDGLPVQEKEQGKEYANGTSRTSAASRASRRGAKAENGHGHHIHMA